MLRRNHPKHTQEQLAAIEEMRILALQGKHEEFNAAVAEFNRTACNEHQRVDYDALPSFIKPQ